MFANKLETLARRANDQKTKVSPSFDQARDHIPVKAKIRSLARAFGFVTI